MNVIGRHFGLSRYHVLIAGCRCHSEICRHLHLALLVPLNVDVLLVQLWRIGHIYAERLWLHLQVWYLQLQHRGMLHRHNQRLRVMQG